LTFGLAAQLGISVARTSVCGFSINLGWRVDFLKKSRLRGLACALDPGSLTELHRLKSELLAAGHYIVATYGFLWHPI
jgi:hypothetical protein